MLCIYDYDEDEIDALCKRGDDCECRGKHVDVEDGCDTDERERTSGVSNALNMTSR